MTQTSTECQHTYINDYATPESDERVRRCMWCDDVKAV